MRPTRFAAAASLLACLVSVSVARSAAAECLGVLATANTTWVEDTGVEIGEVQGFINGAFYLNYDDDTSTTDRSTSNTDRSPNLVIATDQGEIRIWASGESLRGEDGSWVRRLTTASAEGTRSFSGSVIVLELEGTFQPSDGGSYRLWGSICSPEDTQRR